MTLVRNQLDSRERRVKRRITSADFLAEARIMHDLLNLQIEFMSDSPSSVAFPADMLADLASPDIQRHAARMAQDAFTQIFRLTLAGDTAALELGVANIEPLCRNWARAGADDDARALRLALMVSGIDQWGLAYSQVFGLAGIPGVTALLGTLRNGLDAASDARFQQQFARIEAVESDAVDFKMELRRNIHLALWHAMIASDSRDEADGIRRGLGSLMCALATKMPQLGWRLVADALAHIQIRCLTEGAAAHGLAQESNEGLFQSLRASLPPVHAETVFAHANRATVAWQQARRAQAAAAVEVGS
jgi:hypothetical protein